jgi:hypothetical protein
LKKLLLPETNQPAQALWLEAETMKQHTANLACPNHANGSI